MLSRIMLCSVLFACLSSPLAAQSPFLNPRLFVSPNVPKSSAMVGLRISDVTGVFAEVEEQSIQVNGFQIDVHAGVRHGNTSIMFGYELNYALPGLSAGLYTVTYSARTRTLNGTYGPYFTERVWRFLVIDPDSDRVAVEYVNAARQHYFTTALANEIERWLGAGAMMNTDALKSGKGRRRPRPAWRIRRVIRHPLGGSAMTVSARVRPWRGDARGELESREKQRGARCGSAR